MVVRRRARKSRDNFLLETLAALATMALVLVVFFLVRVSFLPRGGLDLVGAEPRPGENRQDPVVVRVSSAGTLHLKGKHVELSALRSAIDEARFEAPRVPILILAEQGSRASLIARVIDQCKLTGASDIRFTLLEE